MIRGTTCLFLILMVRIEFREWEHTTAEHTASLWRTNSSLEDSERMPYSHSELWSFPESTEYTASIRAFASGILENICNTKNTCKHCRSLSSGRMTERSAMRTRIHRCMSMSVKYRNNSPAIITQNMLTSS